MDINITLIFQMVVFVLFIVFTMKYIWPNVINALEARQKTISDGLAAAEKGQRDLELAQVRVDEMIAEAKQQGALIVEQANQRAHHLIEESKHKAREQGEKIIELAHGQVEQEKQAARDEVMQDLSRLVVNCAEGVLKRELNEKDNQRLISALVEE